MTRRTVANPLALAVLAELLMGPIHPYEIGRRLKEHGKDRNIKYNRGSLYMVVEQLRKAGFITGQESVRDTPRPERTVGSLAPGGARRKRGLQVRSSAWSCLSRIAEPEPPACCASCRKASAKSSSCSKSRRCRWKKSHAQPRQASVR